jgi:UTP--glucose-1-phosphate uridylyltransferase
MALLAQREPLYACLLKGKRYDVGTPLGMLKASVELALQREDIGPQVQEWLRGLGL